MAVLLLDSNDIANVGADANAGAGTGDGATNNVNSFGVTFTSPSNTPLYSCKFYLTKEGAATGSYYFKVYSITGTYGSTAKPGSVLATSDPGNAATLTGSRQAIELRFTGANAINLTASGQYGVGLFFDTGTIDPTAFVDISTQNSRTAGGNTWFGLRNGSFFAQTTDKPIFYLYGGKPNAGGLILFE